MPVEQDVADLFSIYSDPRVWRHYPSLRHTDPDTTARAIARWAAGWAAHGLDTWVVREAGSGQVVGYGGCSLADGYWNLGYRFAPEVQGRGYATEVGISGIERARAMRPDLPVVAYLLENNPGSARVAQRCGLTLQHRGPDAGNPDPDAVRLVYADRGLTDAEAEAVLTVQG